MVPIYMASMPPPIPAKKELMTKASRLCLARLMPMASARDLVITDGFEGPAIGGVDQQHNAADHG